MSRVGTSLREEVGFGPLTIAFDDRVLRPRAWTVEQSGWAADLLPHLPEGPVLELCAGAGHIGLLAVHGSERPLVMVDADGVACGYAAENAEAAGRSVDVRHGPMDRVLAPAERFALVLADPPWVPSAEVSRHPEDPVSAIDGGPDGLALVRTCVEVTGRHLLPGGVGLLQVGGADQVEAVSALLEDRGGSALEMVDHRLHERGALVLLRQA